MDEQRLARRDRSHELHTDRPSISVRVFAHRIGLVSLDDRHGHGDVPTCQTAVHDSTYCVVRVGVDDWEPVCHVISGLSVAWGSGVNVHTLARYCSQAMW